MGNQYEDVAILANRDVFEIDPGTDYITETHGPSGWGRTKCGLIGIRLRIKGTDYILPFHTVHLSTKESGRGRQKASCKDIIRIVKDNWVNGDLTPVLVGDFNFAKNKAPEVYNIMNEYFTEVGMNFGEDEIEHIWVGKKEKFSGEIGELIAIDYDYDRTFVTEFGIRR